MQLLKLLESAATLYKNQAPEMRRVIFAPQPSVKRRKCRGCCEHSVRCVRCFTSFLRELGRENFLLACWAQLFIAAALLVDQQT